MERPSQPGDIAREAIKRLATRRQPPTPENFRRAYAEVMGKDASLADWPAALRALLRQWDAHQTGLTQARKREMLERVLINFGSNPDELAAKIANLAKNWAETAASTRVETPEQGDEAVEQMSAGAEPAGEPEIITGAPRVDLARPLAESLQAMAAELMDRWPDLADRARALGEDLTGGRPLQDDLAGRLSALWREVLVRAGDDSELLSGTRRLLEALFRNMGDLVAEDGWLQGQIRAVGALLGGQLNYHVLDEVERSLSEVIQRQGRLRDSLREAKQKLKQLIATFIDRVGELSSSTGQYHERLEGYSARIAQAEDMGELGEVIDSLSADMLSMREAMRQTHVELLAARNHVEEADQRIRSLEQELEEVSALVREDQLTGALNRRGMDEAFEREMARAARLAAPLSLSLLDIDHFKRLNDTLGHQAGDQALVHLARVVRQMLRPTDSLARYGGEEFLILLPNSDVAEAEKVMQRVQRELTRQYFMHDNQKVLITFSAGVVQHEGGEDRQALVARADAAMYRAKSSGRNRVERG
ncbi:MAG: diguanylate cyclase [Thiobacillaceae bacterium]|nr:diguanylate cyclase [Thiobacillaceae bacterium]